MKKLVYACLFALVLSLVPTLAMAESVTFTRGQQVELFDQNGVKVTLTGEVEDSGLSWLSLKAVIENQTSSTVKIRFTGTANGWSLGSCVMGDSGNSLKANSKGKSYIWISYDNADIKCFENLESVCLTFTIENSENETLFTVDDLTIEFGGDSGAVIIEYFTESPALASPVGLTDASKSGSSSSSVNGKLSKAVYRYSADKGDIKATRQTYLDALVELGYTVEGDTVSDAKGKLATVTIEGDKMVVDLATNRQDGTPPVKPGAEDAPAQPVEAEPEAASGVPSVALGTAIKANSCTLTAEEFAPASIIYSYGKGKQTSRYFYCEPQPGSTFASVYGTFTNTGNSPVDIRNIYATIEIDGYTYRADVRALQADGCDFQNDVAAQQTVKCYIYAEVPDGIMEARKECVLHLGFTDDFNYKIISGNLPDFDRCHEVYDVKLTGTTEEEERKALEEMAKLLREYTDKDTVKAVQAALNESGYDCGTPDGVAGKKTAAAITAYQTERALNVTGTITYELLISMGIIEE